MAYVGAGRHARQQAAGVGRVVREVGVHLHHHLGPQRIERVADAAHVGGPEPALLALQQAHAGIGGGELPHQPPGAVGALVVHHQEQHVGVGVQLGQARQQQRDVVGFVVGGDDEARPRGRATYGAQVRAPGLHLRRRLPRRR